MELTVGNRYVIDIVTKPELSNHPFFHHRCVTYLGRDETCTLGESCRFLSDLDLYDYLHKHHLEDDVTALTEHMNICVSHCVDHQWVCHILRDRFQIVQ